MKKLFFLLGISFIILLIVNASWFLSSLIHITVNGVQSLLEGRNLLESISFSVYLKWILLANGIWVILAIVYLFSRKEYKTNIEKNYLHYDPITEPKLCVIIPAYNEEESITKVIEDYKSQKFVEYVLVIDNNSTDNTVSLAEKAGAKVITKSKNKGFSHSYVLGLKEGLKTDANLILTTESDGTYNAYDIKKMISYIDNVDVVIGSRYFQTLTEKGNQNNIMHIWGNLLSAKLIQLKYFSLHHLGAVNLTDVGCLLRLFRRSSLEEIIDKTTYENSDMPIGGDSFPLHLTMITIEKDLRMIEIPVTFNKRIGHSKTRSNEYITGIRFGLSYIWFILIS